MWHHCERHSHRPGRPATHDNHCSLWPYLRLNLGSSLLDGNRGHFEVILAERWLESRRNSELTLSTIRHISFLNSSWFAIQGTKKREENWNNECNLVRLVCAGGRMVLVLVGRAAMLCHAMAVPYFAILCLALPWHQALPDIWDKVSFLWHTSTHQGQGQRISLFHIFGCLKQVQYFSQPEHCQDEALYAVGGGSAHSMVFYTLGPQSLLPRQCVPS